MPSLPLTSKPDKALPGQMIKERRQALGWTQQDLAERIGVSNAYISALESGAKLPTFANTLLLAQELGMEGDKLWEITRQLHEDLALTKISQKAEKLRQATQLQPSAMDVSALPPEITALMAALQEDPRLLAAVRNFLKAIKDQNQRPTVLGALDAFARSARD